MTLAIGDGANDVAMIQEAQVRSRQTLHLLLTSDSTPRLDVFCGTLESGQL